GMNYVTGTGASKTFDQPGTYPVELLLMGESGCDYSLTENTPIHANPLPSFSPLEVYGPAPLVVSFENTTVGGSSYVWEFNDGSQGVTDMSPTHTFGELGTYTVYMQATNEFGCDDHKFGMVHVIV